MRRELSLRVARAVAVAQAQRRGDGAMRRATSSADEVLRWQRAVVRAADNEDPPEGMCVPIAGVRALGGQPCRRAGAGEGPFDAGDVKPRARPSPSSSPPSQFCRRAGPGQPASQRPRRSRETGSCGEPMARCAA